ncbi:MAG TPA: aminotransferase class I/II-fold pyridoxal phosphate-dependent enzyme [Chthonomonadaceae bacterium]|nr:aminotransferase class I/II-fold pyridoxal phosphate-dependent enzyme [Chthonomonadaceae bacterium]
MTAPTLIQTDASRLALHGGTPTITAKLPGFGGGLGADAIDDAEIEAVTAVLRSKNLFRHNPDSQVRAFEQEAKDVLGTQHALMVNSGTSAIVCGLFGLGVGPGDEVIVPAYTYIATAAAVVAVGAVPVIAEIDDSLGLDPADLERKITPRTKAVIPVYMQGVPGRVAAILAVAKRHNLKVLEDCAQCIGGRYHGQMVGTLGDVGEWSLNYFKVLTCGEGGLVFTNDYEVYERACFASDPALPMWMKDAEGKTAWHTPPFSANCFRPSEMLGAMARVQLGKLETILGHTRRLKAAFLDELAQAGTPRGYRLQHVDDPAGDCGISAAILCHDTPTAVRYAEALTAEGLPCGAAHKAGFPDRHIYRYWDSVLDENSPHPSGYPWRDPQYTQPRGDQPPGSVAYSREMCPQSLSLLDRALRFGFNLRMTEDHARLMAKAIKKVDAALS